MTLRFPAAPPRYDQRDQNELRRTLELNDMRAMETAVAAHDTAALVKELTDLAIKVDGTIQDGKVGPSAIMQGAIQLAAFADGLRPVQVVDALPALPDPAYPANALIILSIDHKLYRSLGDKWDKGLDAADITGQITGSQIAPGAIDELNIADFALTATKMNLKSHLLY